MSRRHLLRRPGRKRQSAPDATAEGRITSVGGWVNPGTMAVYDNQLDGIGGRAGLGHLCPECIKRSESSCDAGVFALHRPFADTNAVGLDDAVNRARLHASGPGGHELCHYPASLSLVITNLPTTDGYSARKVSDSEQRDA